MSDVLIMYIFILLMLLFMVVFYLVMFYLPDKRLAEEVGLVPLYEGYCAGLFWLLGYPYVRVACYEEFMVIRWRRQMRLRYDQITRLSLYRRVEDVGIELKVPGQPGCPDGVVSLFCIEHKEELLDVLCAKTGFPRPQST